MTVKIQGGKPLWIINLIRGYPGEWLFEAP